MLSALKLRKWMWKPGKLSICKFTTPEFLGDLINPLHVGRLLLVAEGHRYHAGDNRANDM